VTTLGQLAQIPLAALTAAFSEDMARFLFDIARGVCREAVTERTKPKSIACGKTFTGKLAINNLQMLRRWTEELCAGLTERVSDDRDQNCRIPKLLTVSIQFASLAESHVSKSVSSATSTGIICKGLRRSNAKIGIDSTRKVDRWNGYYGWIIY
jgi:nucleotidyltransferase/DNA polymerase involved in DNA repair